MTERDAINVIARQRHEIEKLKRERDEARDQAAENYGAACRYRHERDILRETVDSWGAWHSELASAIGSPYNERRVVLETAAALRAQVEAMRELRDALRQIANCSVSPKNTVGDMRKVARQALQGAAQEQRHERG